MAKKIFLKFPLAPSLGGAEFHTLKLVSDFQKLGDEIKLLTSDQKLFRLFEKHRISRRRMRAGWEPTSKWSLLLWPLTYLIARIKFKKLLNQIPAGSIFYMQSLIEKLVLTPMLSTPSSSPPQEGGEKGGVIWLEHKIPGRWLTLNPLKFRYLQLARRVQLITVSNFAKEEFVKLGVAEKNIQIVYPTTSPSLAVRPACGTGRQAGPPYLGGRKRGGVFTIGLLSRLAPEKGVLDFVQLLIPELKSKPSWKMVIAGEGAEQKTLESVIRNNHLGNQVRLLGFVNDLDGFFSQISVLAYPTKVREAFGIAPWEAITRGIPVIASNLGALPEIVVPGKNGYLVHPQNPAQWIEYLNKLA